MQIAQAGDRVQVHYVKRFQDGSVASSREKGPLQVTVGVDHPRLPGLGMALVGLTPGTKTVVSVPVERAYGAPDPSRVHRWARTRLPRQLPLQIGKWVRIPISRSRNRWVKILELRGNTVVVDTNHRFAGQSLELEVELVGIQPSSGTNGKSSAP